MLRIIKNSNGFKGNKYKGVTKLKDGRYRAQLHISLSGGLNKSREMRNIFIGDFDTQKEARDARVEYILNLL